MPQKRARARVRYTPQWGGSVEKFTYNFIHRNKWRLDRIHEFEDQVQDALLIFMKIRDRYPRVVEERHFMALYKRALANKYHDQALYMKRKRVVHQDTSQDVSELYTGRIGELTHGGYAAALLAEAPEELKLALKLLAENPDALRSLPRSKHRQNLNMKIRTALGLDENFDFMSQMKELFS